MKIYHEKYVYDAYANLLNDLMNDPEYITKPRGLEVKEIKNAIIKVDEPMYNLYENSARSSPKKYCAAELLWYFSGTNDPTFIEKYASLWKKIKNEDGSVNSAYGNLIFWEKNEHNITQYQWVIESLKKDKDSRQALMHFNKPHHQFFGNKDQVCTISALFHIRNNKLLMTLTMRSNDAIYGFMTDWVFFSILQYHVYLHLKKYYPNLELGSYTHISHSMHLYKKHYDKVHNMLNNEFNGSYIPLPEEPIIDEKGNIRPKYYNIIFNSVYENNIDIIKESDNSMLNWCIQTLKK